MIAGFLLSLLTFPGVIVHEFGHYIFCRLTGTIGTTLYDNPTSNRTVAYVVLWLAVSIAMHAFPSTGDARSLWSAIWSRGTPVLGKLVGIPLVLVIYLGAFGSWFWLDLAYGYLIAIYASRAVWR